MNRADPFQTTISVLFMSSKGRGHGGQVVVARGHGEASYTNYRHGDRTTRAGVDHVVWLNSVAGTGDGSDGGLGAGSLKIPAGVLVHRATRPQRQSVFRVE